MLIWNFNNQGPYTPPGTVFEVALGTAVTFSAGPTVSYSGLALNNPATPAGKTPVKLVPLRVALEPTGVAGVAAASPWGLLKFTACGTASVANLSGFPGVILSPGAVGTQTGVAVVCGTFSVINGTAAGTGSNTLYWQELCGVLIGTSTQLTVGSPAVDLQGFTSVMPGETLAIGCNSAVTGLAAITWVEIPLNSGA